MKGEREMEKANPDGNWTPKVKLAIAPVSIEQWPSVPIENIIGTRGWH
jgi:hypothetical protein